jgi:beta-glucosidase/6-phospho-beta-glucosidase/beta-galactosidase
VKHNFKFNASIRKNYSNRSERRQAAEQVRNALVGMELDIEEEREEHLSAEYLDWYNQNYYFEDYSDEKCNSCGQPFNGGYMGTCSNCLEIDYQAELNNGLTDEQAQKERDWVEGNRILDEYYESLTV